MYIFQVRHLIPYTVFSLTQVLILKPLLRPGLNVFSGSSNGGRCVGMSRAHVTLVFVLIFSSSTVHCAFFVFSCFKPLRKREHPRNLWGFFACLFNARHFDELCEIIELLGCTVFPVVCKVVSVPLRERLCGFFITPRSGISVEFSSKGVFAELEIANQSAASGILPK